MSGHRQAAVALYELDEQDQRLILAELPDDDQLILRNYLLELAELGFDKGQANDADVAPLRKLGNGLDDPRARMMSASAAQMVSLLAREPASFIAAVLALDCWPWTSEFMELLAPHRRLLVRDAGVVRKPAAPARDRCLLESLSAALSAQPADAEPSRTGKLPSVISRWITWTR